MKRSVLKLLKLKWSRPKAEKKLDGQGPGQDFVFCSGLKLSLLFQAGPNILSSVQAKPVLEKSCPCRLILKCDKVKEIKSVIMHACRVSLKEQIAYLFIALFLYEGK